MKCSTTALSKTILHFFLPPPNFFKKQFKVGQTDILSNFCKFTNFFLFTGGCHILNSHTKQMLHHCPFQNYITLFTPPTQIFFISIQSWRGTRDIKFSSLYNFFLFIGGRHILNSDTKQMLHHCPFQNYIALFSPPT